MPIKLNCKVNAILTSGKTNYVLLGKTAETPFREKANSMLKKAIAL